MSKVQQQWISSFWRRIGAFLIDSLLLGMVGFALGMVLNDMFVQMGSWGRLVGFGIALVYFGTMNSFIFKGQTIGKKLLNLRVVNFEGQPIGLARSIIRYVILATPFSLNGVQFSNEVMLSFLIYPLTLVTFGGLFSIVYLYIFNRITRQSLHDLIVGTYVVNIDVEKQVIGNVWKLHLIIVAILFVIAGVAPAITNNLAQSEPFKEMLSVQSALLAESGVTYSSISSNTTIFSSTSKETKTTTNVTVQVFLSSNKIDDSKIARHLAKVVIANYPDARNKDALRVVLTYGYDIGIWSRWSNYTHNFNPSEL